MEVLLQPASAAELGRLYLTQQAEIDDARAGMIEKSPDLPPTRAGMASRAGKSCSHQSHCYTPTAPATLAEALDQLAARASNNGAGPIP